jgi:hypothetical protein
MQSSSQAASGAGYPLQFLVEYPDRRLNRLTTALRLIVAIPILIVLGSIGGPEGGYAAGEHGWRFAGGTGALLFLPPLLLILFRQKYPRWWFEWEPRAAPLLEPDRRLRRADGRPLPLHRRAAGSLA